MPGVPSSSGSQAGKSRAAAGSGELTIWAADVGGGQRDDGLIEAFSFSTSSATATLVPNSAYTEARPNINANPAGVNSPEEQVFDSAGRLWVLSQLSALLVPFTIGPPGTAPVVDGKDGVSLSTPPGGTLPRTFLNPAGLTYDAPANELWVPYQYGSASYAQAFAIDASGKARPIATTIHASDSNASGVQGYAFDRSGVLWGYLGTNYPNSYTTAFRVSGGTATEIPSSQFVTAGGLPVFDASDNLWNADDTSGVGSAAMTYESTVSEFSNTALAGTTPRLLKQFTVPPPPAGFNTRFAYPIGFDPSGTLWLLAEDLDFVQGVSSGKPPYTLLGYNVSGTPTLIATVRMPAPNVFFSTPVLQP
jgi:hypothetical protein